MQPLSDSSSSSFGTADLVGLAIDRHLTEQQALLSGPGMDHMQRRLARDAIERAPQRLAVNGHHAPQALGETLHEAGEAGLERLRVKQTEHSAEGVMARRAMTQAQKLAQVRRFDRPNSAMSEQSSPPDSRVQSAIINTSCRPWRALSCRGSTTPAKQATNSSTGRPQRCIARSDSSHAPYAAMPAFKRQRHMR